VTGNKGQNLLSVDFKTGKEIRLESFQVSLDFIWLWWRFVGKIIYYIS